MNDRTFTDSVKENLYKVRYRVVESPEIVTLVTFLLVFVFFALKAPNFLSVYALSNILTFASPIGILVMGVTYLMISGEFDLSVGSNFAVAGYVFLLACNTDIPPFLAFIMAVGVCTVLGAINGLIVISSGIPSFIVTLGTLLAYRGIVRVLGKGRAIAYNPEMKSVLFTILNGSVTPLNKLTEPAGNFRFSSIWFIVVIIVMSLILLRSRFGNRIFAVGGNPIAALTQGINIKKIKFINFTLSGFFAGLAGAILFSQRFSMNELIGSGYELTAVTAVVLGGTLLKGGQGSIVGSALGVLLLSMMQQGLVLMGIHETIYWGTVGVIIILSMIASTYLGKRE